MSQKFTPLHDRVLIRRVEEADTVRGGIIIPDSAKEKPQEGIVIAVGTGKFEKGQTIPLAVKDGDHVLFGKYAGTEIKIDGEELLIVREEEILGILSGGKHMEKHATKELAGAGKR
jgi:chaperonin GroES